MQGQQRGLESIGHREPVKVFEQGRSLRKWCVGKMAPERGQVQAGQVGGGVVRVEAPESSLEAVAVIQGRGGGVRAGDRVGAVGVERSGSWRDTAEEVAKVIGPGINQE